jgi:hypothetical protein
MLCVIPASLAGGLRHGGLMTDATAKIQQELDD